uniref:Mitochondrial inner membrane protein Mpv17 n=1 Tax=Dermatophagoides pteronyssinus TaxID=6956 RepID=A0A6P6XRS8_DERPT|nr:protein Mpv17-like [Dermatophagoides pteronyssinus]
MNIFRAYNRIMIKHPIKTQCITNACLVATGDIIAQKFIEKQSELLVKRTAKFALFGLVYIGPCISLWYRFLDRSFGRTKQIILKPWQKMIIDQSTFSPAINFFALPILGLMNRKSTNEIVKNIQENYIDIMIASYKIWPAVQIANFYLIPLNYRAIFASMFALIWNSYFTWKLGEKK